MNFFSEFLQEKSKSVISLIRTGIITLVAGLALLGGYAYFRSEYDKVSAQANELDRQLKDANLARQLAEVESKNNELNALKNYLAALKEIDKRIDLLHDFTAEENYKIVNTFPTGTFLDEIDVNESMLTLRGYAASIDLVPAIVENLNETGLFTVVYPPLTTWKEIKADDPLWILTDAGIVVSDLRGLYAFEVSCKFSAEEGEQN